MRILHIINSLRAGGKERQLIELLKGLQASPGCRTELVILSDWIEYPEFERLGIPTHILVRRSRRDLAIFGGLHGVIRRFRPQIVHSWNSMCSVYAAPLARLTGAAFVNGVVRDAPGNAGFGHADWLRIRLTLPFSDIVLGNSLAGLEAYRIPRGKGHCIHNGFDMSRVADLAPAAAVRTRLGIATPHIVGMVAAFAPRKDWDGFFEMARRISQQRDDVTFLAVGDGELLEDFSRKLEALPDPKIRILGRRTDVEDIVGTFSAGVLASRMGEGTPNVVMEYMALGKPVVATDIGGTRELVQQDGTGYLVAPDDVDALTANVLKLLDNGRLARAFGDAGRRRIETDFSLARMTQDHERLYRSLIGGV